MSNGKVALQAVPQKGEIGQIPKKKVHVYHKKKMTEINRFDLVADVAFSFFLVPFAIFVGVLAFFSGGFEASCRKALEVIEGAKKRRKTFDG